MLAEISKKIFSASRRARSRSILEPPRLALALLDFARFDPRVARST